MSPLPRGRHGIPEELVEEHQRLRLMSAACAAIAEGGYASLVVGDVIERAGVSRATFYKLFEDKHDCVLAAQRWAYECLRGAVSDAFEAGGEKDWPGGIAAGVEAALEFASRRPGETRLVLASSQSPSEPALAPDDLAVDRELRSVLRAGSRSWPGARAASGLSEEAAVGAAISLLGARLAAEGELGELREDLIQIILSPYLGDAEARRVALAA